MVQFIPEYYSKVLEIGCGEGNFKNNLNYKNEYWGVEPNEIACSNAKKKLDRVLEGTYQDVEKDLPNSYFDLIICNDVIEHMRDHEKFLQSIKKKIKKNGVLISSVPNVRYVDNLFNLLKRKDWKYVNSGILDKTHLRFFTKKSLKRILEDNGFVIEIFKGINPKKRSSLLKQFNTNFLIFLFGKDSRFLQFGFRIKQK